MVVRVTEELAILEELSSGLVHDTKRQMDLFTKLGRNFDKRGEGLGMWETC